MAQTESEQFEEFLNMINSDQRPVQFEGLVGLRRLIAEDIGPVEEEILDSAIIPKILEMMTWENEHRFQFESAWCLVNICAGEEKFADRVIDLGGLDIVINLLDSPLCEIVENAARAISNIAAGSFEQRDICLQKGCLNKLIQALEKFPASNEITENALRGIANFFRGNAALDYEDLLPALPVLHKHISEVHSPETLRYALGCFSYITHGRIQEVIDQGSLPFLIQHLCNANAIILVHAVRAVGNITSGDSEQTNELLKFPEFLPRLFELLIHPKAPIRREALWAISNITAGDFEQIEMIVKNEEYITKLKYVLATDKSPVAKEAAFAILNLLHQGAISQVDFLIEKFRIMKSFPRILTEFGESLKERALGAILNLLEIGCPAKKNVHIKSIKEAGLVEIIEDLAFKDSVLKANADLILKYFSVENPEDCKNNSLGNDE